MQPDGASRRVAVAVSGGRDSTALLHCTVRAAAGSGIEVVALHVHHGLVAEADDWRRQLRDRCRRWGVEFHWHRLAGTAPRGASVEAWARRERYDALAGMAHASGCATVLLAHHRRDQAETFVLQALRGGGPAGLAAMPRVASRWGTVWLRPWLDQPRSAIESYLRRHRIAHVDDASNADRRYARNRLRIDVWPALTGAFADAETALASAARAAQQAAALAAEVAAIDRPLVSDGDGLSLPRWLDLPPARRCNALRAWLAGLPGGDIPQSLVDRLIAELPGSTAATWPSPAGLLRLHRGRLALQPAPVAGEAPAEVAPTDDTTLDLRQPGRIRIDGWAGCIEVVAADSDGAPVASLAAVTVRERRGGERFRLAPNAVARSLKKQYQALGIPAWQRGGPLLYATNGELLFVAGLGIDAAQRAAAGAMQRRLRWIDDASVAMGAPRRAG